MIRTISTAVLCSFLLCSCSDHDNSVDSVSSASTSKDNLVVHFTNNAASLYPITSIELMQMGTPMKPVASGVWESDILPDTLFPGETKTFTLPIPTGDYCRCRLTVIDSNKVLVKITEQVGYVDSTALHGTITHWGSDYRDVDVTVGKDRDNKLLSVNGWGDMAVSK